MKANKLTRGLAVFPHILVLFIFLAGLPALGWAAEKSGVLPSDKIVKGNSPIHIGSDRMEVDQKGRTIIFQGHVVAQQEDLTITGNRLKVNAAAGEKPDQPSMMEKIDRIEVEGDVKIAQKDMIATAEKAVYYHQEQKIVLLGQPVVSQGKDSVRGRLITLYLKEGKSIVEGGEQTPVKAILHPNKKD